MQYSSVTHSSFDPVPQDRPISPEQVPNDAGGYVYKVYDWQMLDRFLIIGAAGGTYYVREPAHVIRNYDCLLRCLEADANRAIGRIVEVSVKGLAVKQDPGVFALAVAAASNTPETRALALSHVNEVCRTGATFFQFLAELKRIRNLSGRAVRRAISDWYTKKTPDALAYQLVKYRERAGWSHRDVLRLAHGKYRENGELVKWAVTGNAPETFPSRYLEGFLRIKTAETSQEAARLVGEYDLPREAVPNQFLDDPAVWEALLPTMPLTALIRNLGNMSKVGLLETGASATSLALKKIGSAEYLRKSRVHPLAVLLAMRTYQSGKGLKGSNVWTPVPAIVAALDDAFYLAFHNVTPMGKRMLIGLDVSGSMRWRTNGGASPLLPAEIGAALAMIWATTEPHVEVMGFADEFRALPFHRKMSLDEAMKVTESATFGRTDCSLPARWATQNGRDFDAFTIITDNDTWAGDVHPKVALDIYRKERVRDALQVVIATTATQFSIADPGDPLSLDIAGFSADVPQVVGTFLGMA